MKHFFEKGDAEQYFKSIERKWKEHLKNYKGKKIEDIFSKKGWKVK